MASKKTASKKTGKAGKKAKKKVTPLKAATVLAANKMLMKYLLEHPPRPQKKKRPFLDHHTALGIVECIAKEKNVQLTVPTGSGGTSIKAGVTAEFKRLAKSTGHDPKWCRNAQQWDEEGE